jgi:predicted DNA-binding transcriptional regulator AlpA
MTSLSVETLENLRVLSEPEAIRLTGISKPTWERMRARGETPPLVRISRCRIGYRVGDLRKWIEARIESSKLGKRDILDAG